MLKLYYCCLKLSVKYGFGIGFTKLCYLRFTSSQLVYFTEVDVPNSDQLIKYQ